MKFKIHSVLLIVYILIAMASCTHDMPEDYMDWELVSVSDAEDIKVVIRNRTATDFPNSSIIYIEANYREGDVVLKCSNHDINFTLVGPNDSYTNPEMGFSLTSVDRNTLKIYFNENASGTPEMSDQITITNSNGDAVCNTFLFIDRTFGEINPTE
ncbi:MAG: cytochrome P460 family protein [Muribaculaceae bacterium]|nr:cytochrome P460 family protein [Muribaculaceae bacterium]